MKNNEKFIKTALPFALQMANAEHPEDVEVSEEVITDRANELLQDAQLEEPTTDEGKQLRERTLSAIDGSVPSPFTNKTGYDYTKLRTDTTIESLKEVFAVIGKYPNLIPDIDESDEVQNNIGEAYNNCSLELFNLFNQHNVRLEDYGYLFGILKAVVSSLDDTVKQQVQGHRTEIFSRLLNVKNPGDGKFDSNFAKYDDLVKLLLNVRKETGDDMNDYFNITTE